ncbi:MAG: sulfatase-like hydrolase/transferase [Candidatus Brocadiaceae bacterium]|jgi:arylsulfatase A-like enzyme
MAEEPGRDREIETRGFPSFRRKLVEEGRLPPIWRPERGGRQPQRRPADRPNVLWLMADQLRADTFGFMGHPAVETPNIDRLAAEGLAFTRMYASEPVCVPSRASMLTGHYPYRNGAIANGYPMRPGEEVLTRLFAEAGWRTADVGKSHCGRAAGEIWEEQYTIEDRFGATKPSRVPFDPGNFPGVTFIANRVCDNSDRVLHGKYPAGEKLTKSYILATEAQKWLYWDEDPRPFFLRVSFDDPHPPVIPPEPYYSMYGPEDAPPELWRDQDESMQGKPQTVRDYWRYTHNDEIALEDHKKHAACYFGLVSHLDAQIGRILDYLEELGLSQNTLVVLNSDHGHMIGEHGLVHKGPYCYEGVTRIPTVFRWPGRVPAGVREDVLAEGVDLMPTLLDLLGLEVPDGLDGRSLAAHVRGDGGTAREYAFTQWQDYVFCVRGDRWKLTYYEPDGEGELYDLDQDPWEKVNLYHDDAAAEMREHLLEQLERWRQQNARPEDLPGPDD